MWRVNDDGALIPYDVGPDCFPSGKPFRDLIPRRKPAVEGEPGEPTFATYEEAADAAHAAETAFIAALPGRMQAVADEINERLAGVLPEGMRFEWVADER
jgi:hypothetical protein